MIRITDILDKILEYDENADIELVKRSYVYSAQVHEGQVRLSGEPYLSHPLEVANILADMRLDVVSIASGLLHDVIEDTHTTEEALLEMFGPEIQHIVKGVTKLSKLEEQSVQEHQAENLRKMLLAMADDIRVILIKLADRLHNMQTLEYHKTEEKRKNIAQETLDIYAPLASRLGIYWMKRELEDIAFMYILPEEYRRIGDLVKKDQKQREKKIEDVKRQIREMMTGAGISCEVLGRYKHFFSIYEKMRSQGLEFEDVYDIIAFRVILDTKSQCYEALGLLHSKWKPIDIKFKDYIGRPKPNMYQSLHTTVVLPTGERIEIQIRTKEMDRVAKSGIAAHWGYKEGKCIDEKMCNKFAWLQEILENQENIRDPEEFLENVRIDLFPDEVYVFTPAGEIKTLPRGATPVDYAYMIHTEVGNFCVGAKVNGKMVPLRTELKTGDSVQIVTNKSNHPSRDWLNFVKTVKARSRIKQWIKQQEREKSLTLGRELCEKAFRKHKLNFNDMLRSEEMEKAKSQFGFKTVEDLIASVGFGKITPLQVVRAVQKKPVEDHEDSILEKFINRVRTRRSKSGVTVKGVDDVLVKFAKCCRPVPGDPIKGFITLGAGVTVHKADCINLHKSTPERMVDVAWNGSPEDFYPVDIRIRSLDRVGLLRDLTDHISRNGANIINANSNTLENKQVDSYFTITVNDREHLDRILSGIKNLKNVQYVKRITG